MVGVLFRGADFTDKNGCHEVVTKEKLFAGDYRIWICDNDRQGAFYLRFF